MSETLTFFFYHNYYIAGKKCWQTRQVVNPESSTSVLRWGHIRFRARPWILIKLLHWTRNLMWFYFSSNFELNNLTSKWIQYTNPQKLNTFVISFNSHKHLNAIVFYWNVDRIRQPWRSISFYIVYYQKASLKCIFWRKICDSYAFWKVQECSPWLNALSVSRLLFSYGEMTSDVI